MTLEMIPDDDTAVIPAMASAPAGPQSEDQTGHRPGRGSEHEIDPAGARVRPQVGHELVGRVLQPQREQQQQHADLRAGADEFRARRQREHTAVAEGEPAEQVERDRARHRAVRRNGRGCRARAAPPRSLKAPRSRGLPSRRPSRSRCRRAGVRPHARSPAGHARGRTSAGRQTPGHHPDRQPVFASIRNACSQPFTPRRVWGSPKARAVTQRGAANPKKRSGSVRRRAAERVTGALRTAASSGCGDGPP